MDGATTVAGNKEDTANTGTTLIRCRGCMDGQAGPGTQAKRYGPRVTVNVVLERCCCNEFPTRLKELTELRVTTKLKAFFGRLTWVT